MSPQKGEKGEKGGQAGSFPLGRAAGPYPLTATWAPLPSVYKGAAYDPCQMVGKLSAQGTSTSQHQFIGTAGEILYNARRSSRGM